MVNAPVAKPLIEMCVLCLYTELISCRCCPWIHLWIGKAWIFKSFWPNETCSLLSGCVIWESEQSDLHQSKLFLLFHLNFIIIISLCHSNAGSCFIMEKWWYYAIHIWYGNSSFGFFVWRIINVDCTGLWFLKHYLLAGNLVSLVVVINGFSLSFAFLL